MVVPHIITHENKPLPKDPDWWRGAVIYQILSAVVPGFEQRRSRGSDRDHPPAALRGEPRGGRDLDLALLSVADAGLRLRRDELPRRRSDVRHARRLRRADRAGARAGPPGDDRPGAQPHLGPAPLVPREPRQPRQSQGQLVRLGGREARRDGAEQLAVDLRRAGLGVGQRAAAVLPAQLPQGAAGSELPRAGGAGRASGGRALLAGAGRGRVPARHDQLLLLRPGAARQPGAGRRSCATIRRRRR